MIFCRVASLGHFLPSRKIIPLITVELRLPSATPTHFGSIEDQNFLFRPEEGTTRVPRTARLGAAWPLGSICG